MAKDQSEDIPWGEGEKDQKVYEELSALMSMNDRKIPALKVLSAVAVCEKYKDWLLSHRTSWAASNEGEIRLDWRGNCHKPCDPHTEPYNFHCGFCRLEN